MNELALSFRRRQWLITLVIAVSLVAAALLTWPTHATRAQGAGKSAPSSWTLTTLYTFTGAHQGIAPAAGVIPDNEGNLYGTTAEGGRGCEPNNGCGTVFMVNPAGMARNLYVFKGHPDGESPTAPLVHDSAGNLYGTTNIGGRGSGTVFKIAPDRTQTILHAFSEIVDGGYPRSGLVLDSAGNLYGTASAQGSHNAGTVFKLNKGGFTVLYAFTGGADGDRPQGGLVRDSEGNLYGTTFYGGLENSACEIYGSCGVVFRLDSTGKETTLYSFTGGADGGNPESTLVRDSKGNLYGTTYWGGNTGCAFGACGVVFKLRPDGREIVLYSFTGQGDGSNPAAGVIADAGGNLYGTTQVGGKQGCDFGECGVVFKVDKLGVETVLHSFTGGADGSYSEGALLRDSFGNLYGTTVIPSTVFRLSPPQ